VNLTFASKRYAIWSSNQCNRDPSFQAVLTYIDILVTIPLGVASDRGHRRLILCLNVCGLSAFYVWVVAVGYMRHVPITVMLFGPLFSLIGGGDCVFMSTVAAVVTQIAPDESQRFVQLFSPISLSSRV
jgi:MFS family permease